MPGQNARLGRGDVSFQSLDAAGRDLLLAQALQQQAAGFVIAHHSDRQNIDAQRGQVHDRIGAASGEYRALPVLQDQHRRFPRDPGDFAKHELVGDQVGHHRDRHFGERLDNLLPALAVFGMFIHQLK